MPVDYKNTEDGDLFFENGDLVIAESTVQHQVDLLTCGKGHYRESIDTSVGLIDFIDDDAIGDLPGIIRDEFEKDGMLVNGVNVTATGKISYDAEY